MVEDCERFKRYPGRENVAGHLTQSQVLGVLQQTPCSLEQKVMAYTNFWESEVYWRKCGPKQGNPIRPRDRDEGGWMLILSALWLW